MDEKNGQNLDSTYRAWKQQGGQWLSEAERMLIDASRLVRDLEKREQAVLERETQLDVDRLRLEQHESQLNDREQTLAQREKLLTDGMVHLTHVTQPSVQAEPMLEDLYLEIATLRESIKMVSRDQLEDNSLANSSLTSLSENSDSGLASTVGSNRKKRR